MRTNGKLTIQGVEVGVKRLNGEDYISLTDMLSAKNGEYFVHDWLKNRNTLEYIGIWERIHNPSFNYVEFDIIKSQSGLNRFRISVKEFAERTNSVSLLAVVGRYGGTFAHKDIAMEFGMWISPEFKIYLVKEFQRLKEHESKQLQWSARRELAKINYRIQTDAIKTHIVPKLGTGELNFAYSDEADILNMALFGQTAIKWRAENKDKDGNIRDYATIEQLLVLANMESHNAEMIKDGIPMAERIKKLNEMARQQMTVLMQSQSLLLKEGV